MDRGGNIEELISSGLDLISSLIPHGSSVEELKSFMERMLEQLVHSSHASILFLIRVSLGVREVWKVREMHRGSAEQMESA